MAIIVRDKSQAVFKMRILLIALWMLLLPTLTLANSNKDNKSAVGYVVSESSSNEGDLHYDRDCLLDARKQARIAQEKCDSRWRGENVYMRLHCSNKARKQALERRKDCALNSGNQ